MDNINADGGAAGSPGSVSPGAASPGAASPGAASPGAVSPGAGQLRAGTPFFPVTVNEVTPSETAGMDVHSVMNILHNLDAEGVQEAASAHTALGETLERIANNLVANGQTLAGSWQGDAAQAAVETFQQMHAQTSQLASQAKQTGQVLEWAAGVLRQYKNLPTPVGDSATPAGQAASAPGAAIGDVVAAVAGTFSPAAGHQARANAQAQKYLDELNQHLVTANNSMPPSIGHAPSAPTAGAAHVGAGGAGVPGGTGRAAGGPVSGPRPGAGSGSGSGNPSGTSAPLPHAESAARLQSSALPGGTGTLTPSAPAPAAPAGPGGTAVPGIMPVGPVAGTAARAGGSLGNTTSEDQSEDESSLASAEDGENEAVSNATIGDRRQNPMSGEGSALPMMGVPGSGQPDQERQRQAWINEDRNIWGVPQSSADSEIGGH